MTCNGQPSGLTVPSVEIAALILSTIAILIALAAAGYTRRNANVNRRRFENDEAAWSVKKWHLFVETSGQ